MTESVLSLKVGKRFPGFSLECEAIVEDGVTALFGPSGSGKTTLLNCIAGVISPDEGRIEALGRVLYSSADGARVPPEKRRFGYVLQEPALFPHMNVWGNVVYGYDLTRRQDRRLEPDQLMELLQLGPLRERDVRTLSGGERQRVALARALAVSPDMLLLDEPLASLDWAMRGVIIRYLKQIRVELGTPMLYVSHSISEVLALADTTIVVSGGKIVAQGPTSRVLVDPTLSHVAELATLENLFEAEVSSTHAAEGLAEIRVGDATLLASDVHAAPGESIMVSIRAGDVILSLDIPLRTSARNAIRAVIDEIHPLGQRVLVYTDIGTRLMVEITPGALTDLQLEVGQVVYAVIKANSIMIMDPAAPHVRRDWSDPHGTQG